MANAQNLKRPTATEAREKGRKGGIASGEARRERKRMSEMYAEFLAKEHDVVMGGEKKKIAGHQMLAQVMAKILARGDSASVSLMKEIREATEGSKSTISNPDGSPLIPSRVEFVVVDSENRDSPTVRTDNDTVEI